MTKSTGQRQYRACVRCRKRKSRIEGKAPCGKCVREGAHCALAGSRRGGDYTHFRSEKAATRYLQREQSSSTTAGPLVDKESTDEPVHRNLQNPSDALLILAHTAGMDASASAVDEERSPPYLSPLTTRNLVRAQDMGGPDSGLATGIYGFPLLKEGILSPAVLEHLITYYNANYHAYFPIVPSSVLQSSNLPETVKAESFLLTAVLAVASRDRLDLELHPAIWRHLDKFLLDVALGKPSTRHVGYVEGLLLLSEWTPVREGRPHDGGENAAWSLVGLAVRLAYLLRLEETSFKEKKALDPMMQRKRMAWTFTYLCDRQISIRMGQAFWSRGPSLSTQFMAKDFPTLQPKHSYEEDFASFLQAQLDLTTLFGNAHDILFASKQRMTELMWHGDYGKYIDDTRRAILAWEHAWDRLAVSCQLQCCLEMMKQYLRLYVNAFAFQAILFRSSSSEAKVDKSEGALPKPSSAFPNSTMASPDARSIYEAFEAAENLLKIAVEGLHPEKHLRYMPARFYLYEIHSAVFLYKAYSVGAISDTQRAETTGLMRRFINVLGVAATDDNHIASKYARLLQGLWSDKEAAPAVPSETNNGAALDGTDLGRLEPFSTIPDYGLLTDANEMQSFNCMNIAEGLFSMPGITNWESSDFPPLNLEIQVAL
ncbi:hypothetical protein DL769_009916 [Monosporascus sp. CRB-8-3]|nr:hypothetical protein DL769_009916 [Monosporascus sp. CRB-8-3]